MKRKEAKQFSKIIVILLLIGAAIVILNTRADPAETVQTRSVEQYSNMFFSYTVIRYPAKAEVLNPSQFAENLSIGVNVDTDELDFSRVESGSSVKKQLNLTTRDEKPSRITVKSKGTIESLIKFDKNDFILKGTDVVSVTMDAGGWAAGNYTGEVAVIVQRSSSDLLRQFLGF